MSLLNPTDPVETFIAFGRRFIAEPNPLTGIDFDDATVALKRHLRSHLKDEALAVTLDSFARLIRDQAVERLAPQFEVVVSRLRKDG